MRIWKSTSESDRFEKTEDAQAYLKSSLFTEDVVKELKDFLEAEPDVRIYDVADQ